MYNFNKVLNGLSKYVDSEIVSKLNGWQKWVVGGGLGIYLSNANNIYHDLKEKEFVKMMGIIGENDEIDIDKIYHEMKKQAEKTSITFDLPFIGTITLNEQDIDKMYEHIMMQ